MQIPLIGTTLLLLVYHVFFYHTAFGLGWLAFLLLVYAYIFLIHKKNTNFPLSFTCSLIAFSCFGLSTIMGNEGIQFLEQVTAWFLTFFVIFLARLEKPFSWSILLALFAPLVSIIFGAVDVISQLSRRASDRTRSSHLSKWWPHIRGIIFAFPILFILLLLFRSADPIYDTFVGHIVDQVWERMVITIFLGTMFLAVGIVRYILPALPTQKSVIKQGVHQELKIFLGLIAFAIGTFVIVQIRYLFLRVNETDLSTILGSGYTYSQYVTKGFFELIVATVICITVLLVVKYRIDAVEETKQRSIQYIAAVIGLEMLVLIASAFQRLQLYVSAHGLTLARGYGAVFLISLTLITALCVVQLFFRLDKKLRFILWSIPGLVFLFGLHFANFDRLVATRFPPTVNGQIDYYYLSRLSTDSHDSWTQGVLWAKRVVTEMSGKKEWSTEDKIQIYWAKRTVSNYCKTIEETILLFGDSDEIRQAWNACLPNAPFDLAVFDKTGKFSDLPLFIQRRRGWQSFNYSSYQGYFYLMHHKELLTTMFETQTLLQAIQDHLPKNWEESLPRDRRIDPMFLK